MAFRMVEVLAILLLSMTAHALNETDAFLIRIETHSIAGLVQREAILQKAGKLTMTRNSNAHCPPGPIAHIGHFNSDIVKLPALSDKLRQISKLSSLIAYSDNHRSPHAPRYFRDQDEVTQQPFLKNAIEEVIKDQCGNTNWEHTDTRGLEILSTGEKIMVREFKNGKPVSGTTKSLASAGCKNQDASVRCEVPEFGELIFVPKK